MKYGLFPGGKQIRSKLLIDVGKIFSIDYKTLLHVSAAVECIHAYSLIHDDLPCMDDDILRRGKLTVHKKFSESTAILAGNSLLTISFEILSSNNFNVSSDVKNELIHSISRCAGHSGVAGGQHLDLEYEKQRVSMLKIIEMQRKKTGMLFEFCCIAPIIINKDKKNFKKFSSIGSDIGLLFQIADDLIDQVGNSKKVGKKGLYIGSVQLVTKNTSRFDVTKFKEDHPELYAKYIIGGVSNELRTNYKLEVK